VIGEVIKPFAEVADVGWTGVLVPQTDLLSHRADDQAPKGFTGLQKLDANEELGLEVPGVGRLELAVSDLYVVVEVFAHDVKGFVATPGTMLARGNDLVGEVAVAGLRAGFSERSMRLMLAQ
jgi:hypothetical protein